MTIYIYVAVLFAVFFVAPPNGGGDEASLSFKLRTTNGQIFELGGESTQSRLTVVCFVGIECPLARLYAPRLNELAQEFADQDVRFIGVDSNRQDSEEELVEFADSLNLQVPVAKDFRNVVADQFQAERTPEVFVVDQNLRVVYRGRVDDQYQPGIAKPRPTRDDLRAALQELLAGQAVSQPVTETEGCIIGRIKESEEDSPTTFARQVSRILQTHCVDCHRTGDIGPFPLTDYEEVVGWSEMILEVVDDGRMPPWHANPEFGEFANAREMPETDKQILRDWVAAGSPFGNPEELPALKPQLSEWQLPREPDLVVAMSDRPFNVPAEGTVDYQYFVVDPGFVEDKWVVAAEVRPGSRSVVHHSIVFVRPPDGVAYRGLGWLGAYVPGQRETAYPKGHGRRIPAGSKFVFQQHYTPTGKSDSDITSVGLVFADEQQIEQTVYTLISLDQEFEIPPHANAHEVEATVPYLPRSGRLLGFAPHMHYRGKSFRLVTRSGGRDQILLDIPRYDFNWQHTYKLKDPIPLESLDEIRFTATFDNSANNPVNPDPGQTVYWGDQTWEEMAVAFFEIAEPRESAIQNNEFVAWTPKEFSEREKIACDTFVNEFFERFDKNRDRTVVRNELAHAMRREFEIWDNDGNDVLDREEVFLAVEWRFREQDELEDKSRK